MDVADQLPEVGVLLHNDGLVAILEEMPGPSMVAVIGQGIAGEEPPHEPGESLGAASEQQMGMVGEEGPCVDRGLCGDGDLTQALEESLAVLSIRHDLSAGDSAEHDVVQGARGVEPGLARHRRSFLRVGWILLVPQLFHFVNNVPHYELRESNIDR